MSNVTQILSKIEQGDPSVADQLLPLVYDELRKLAQARLANEKPGQTLQATALVHDAYIRLVDVNQAQHWNSRGHFFAAAAEAMRRILIDNALRKKSQKRGGEYQRIEVSEVLSTSENKAENILAINDALLAHSKPDSRLDQLALGLSPTIDAPTSKTEEPGSSIGPFKLIEQIGEGGFGVVYMAEQTTPVRRKVALKVVKPGMDTRQVVARFEAEQQALAMMDHPGVAKVLDAGTTDSGRPYFVMELVKGISITDYCDQCSLTNRERLGLFIQVCQAVSSRR